MPIPNSGERRAFVRAKRVLCVNHRLNQAKKRNDDSAWCLSATHDMSFNGISFYSDCEYKKGDVLELHVLMSGILDIFKGYAEVVRVNKKKNGAYFFIAVRLLEKKKATKIKKDLKKKEKKI